MCSTDVALDIDIDFDYQDLGQTMHVLLNFEFYVHKTMPIKHKDSIKYIQSLITVIKGAEIRSYLSRTDGRNC